MQIFEFKKKNMESIAFNEIDGVWHMRVSDESKKTDIGNFCVDLCKKCKLRTEENHEQYFSESELVFLMKFFRSKGYIVDRRDTVLEERLKTVLKTLDKEKYPDLPQSLEYLSYHDQLVLAESLAKIFS